MAAFDHERLDVYHVALEFVVLAEQAIQSLPQGQGELADQLKRARTSIVLNIAEGAGEFSKKEKVRFYRMARRSATECAAVLDVCLRLKLSDEKQLEVGKSMLARIVSMLIGLIKNVGGSGKGMGRGMGMGKKGTVAP